jgi:hypothetical protein
VNTLRRLTADPARTALLVAGGLGFVLIGAAPAAPAARFPGSAEEVSSVVPAVAGLGTVIAPPIIGSAVDAFGVGAIPLGVTGMLVLAGVCAHALRLAGRRHERQ